MKYVVLGFCLVTLAQAARVESPSGSRQTPPTIGSVSPRGWARGTTVELTVEGLNLAKTSAIYFSEPGVKGPVTGVKELPDVPEVRLGSNGTASTVDLGPLPPRYQVTLEVEVSSDASVGPVDFRLLTPRGTTLTARAVVEPFYGESPDREPNDTPEDAFESFLPSILAGTISKPGDVDYFKIRAEAGEDLVFWNSGPMLGSALEPTVTVNADDGKTICEFVLTRDQPARQRRFGQAGVYYVRVSDGQQGGSANHMYRIAVGKLPVVLTAFPLGVQRSHPSAVAFSGFHLGKAATVSVNAETPDLTYLQPKTLNRVKLAVGELPEVGTPERIGSVSNAMSVHVGTTVNGHVTTPAQYFRFHAAKGEQIVIDVNARRLGSQLDSLIEVLDSQAKPIETMTIRAVSETATSLRDHDSASPGIRLATSTNFDPGDYIMIGGEIVRIKTIPPNADNDFIFESFGGERIAYFQTSSEAHALDSPAYKVEAAPPGAKFPPNGLPTVHLTYRNDDGGPGYGKDSRLDFRAPAEGDYILKLADVRGMTGPEFAYRLSIRHPAPSYTLTESPTNPNIPAGGRIPITITAMRTDGHNDPIGVDILNLPRGIHASHGVINPDDTRTTIILSADADASMTGATPFAVSDGKGHVADPEDRLKLISLIGTSDVQLSAETKAVTLTPDRDAEVSVVISRHNGFAGRVPVEVRNLPPGVEVSDTGLNGVLINENEVRRSFKLHMLPTAKPLTQPIYASALVETRAGGQQNTFTGESIQLTLVPKTL